LKQSLKKYSNLILPIPLGIIIEISLFRIPYNNQVIADNKPIIVVRNGIREKFPVLRI
jgi:hypothetical protein